LMAKVEDRLPSNDYGNKFWETFIELMKHGINEESNHLDVSKVYSLEHLAFLNELLVRASKLLPNRMVDHEERKVMAFNLYKTAAFRTSNFISAYEYAKRALWIGEISDNELDNLCIECEYSGQLKLHS